MVMDMEGEFYKLAKDILGKPKNLYKMTSISPHTARVTMMGADEFIVVGSILLKDLSKGKESIAYSKGFKCGKQMFKSLIKEFDEEVERLEPKKLYDLGLALSTNTGWGELELVHIKEKKSTATIGASNTIELKYKKSKHHMVTCGFLAGISSLCFRKDIQGTVEKVEDGKVLFKMAPA